MSTTPRLAWIGIKHIHTPGFSAEVVKRGFGCAGVYDEDADAAAKAAEKLGGQVASLSSLAEDTSVDAYVITSETFRHLGLVRAVADAGKPIFVEKPIGVSGEASTAIADILVSKGIVFQTGYFMRGGDAVQTLRKMLQQGLFGTVTRVRGSICHNGALGGWFDTDWRWMADRKRAGVGAFGDLGTHGLDLLMWLFGDVVAATGALSMGTARYEGCDEYGEGLLKFSSGAIGTLTASWDDIANPIRLQIAGTEGHALLNGELKVAGKDGKFEVVTDLEPAVAGGFNAFLDAVEGKDAELVTPQEAVARDRVMDAIYRGAETESWIRL
ncbi:MAG: Gfo/Idh/MocA family oxidoreductase [Armatimonadetes bacterium]|nr:Gfo/Idh/MocA family oxidoreductase [Armatimonadota bacterium]